MRINFSWLRSHPRVCAILVGIQAVLLAVPCRAQDLRARDRIIESYSETDGLGLDPKEIIETTTAALNSRIGESKEMAIKLLFARGVAYLRCGKLTSAEGDINEVCKLQDKNLTARCLRARILVLKGRPDDAIKEAKEMHRLNPNSEQPYIAMAAAFYSKGDLVQAYDNIEAGLERRKNDPYLWRLRGEVLFGRDPVECVKSYNKYLEYVPSIGSLPDHRPYFAKGTSLWMLNRHHEACINLVAANKIIPADFGTLRVLGSVYLETEKNHSALYCGEKCVKEFPDEPGGYVLAALAYARFGRVQDAERMARRVSIASERDNSLNGPLGDIMQSLGKYREAIEFFDRALAIGPDSLVAARKASLLASCPDDRIRNGELAKKLAESAVADEKVRHWNQWRVKVAVAEAYAECSQFDKAVTAVKEAIESAGPEFGSRNQLDQRLSSFQQKRPFRLSVPKETKKQK